MQPMPKTPFLKSAPVPVMASAFAGDLCNMYRRYAADRGWRFDIMEMAENDLGGIRQLVAEISGHEVFTRMKFESGVHRVQRADNRSAGPYSYLGGNGCGASRSGGCRYRFA